VAALGPLGAAAAIAVSGTAHADGLALSRFEPAERGSRFFLADSLELHAPLGSPQPVLAFGVASSYAYRTRVFGTADEGVQSRLVEHALYLHPGGSVVISPGARFALDVPVAAVQRGRDTDLAGVRYAPPLSPRLGDIRASFDLHLLGPMARAEDGVALAGGVSAWLPTGSTDDLTGDTGARFGVHVLSAARSRSVLASAGAGYMYRRDGQLGGSRLGSELNLVLAVAYSDALWTVGPELRATTLLYDPLVTRTTPVEGILGARRVLDSFRVGAGIGTSLVGGLGAPHVRLMLSLEWAPPPPKADRDGDGVPDADDACPDVPGPSAASPYARGCPLAPASTPPSTPFPPPLVPQP
jgi:hypothetical protein